MTDGERKAGRIPRVPFLRRLRYAAETVAAYLVYVFFRLLPLPLASDAGGALLRLIGPHMGISRVARDNLDMAFPEKTAEEKRRILTGMWDNLGRVMAEYPHLHRIWRHIELRGGEHLAHARDTKEPAIFFGGHIANWEISALSAKAAGLPVHLVYRKPNNPGVDSLLRRARDSGAAGHIEKGPSGAKEIFRVLRQGGAVGMLLDQKTGNGGIPVPFFGHNAMTTPAPAQFALKLGCKLYPTRAERLRGCDFRLTIFPPLAVVDTGDETADIARITGDINALLESWVRERPEQWLWIHKRWSSSLRIS